jgi:hypothetical protein
MIRRTGIILVVMAPILGTVMIVGMSSASASPPPDHKVTICHATHSATNPYVEINVDVASAGFGTAGHADHAGPVPTSPDDLAQFKAEGVHWGDVIPAYSYGDFSYRGLNFDDAGKSLVDNGCKVPEQPPETVPYRIVRRMPLEKKVVRLEAGLVPSISCDGVNYTISFSDGTVETMAVGTSRNGSILRVWSEGMLLAKVTAAEVC